MSATLGIVVPAFRPDVDRLMAYVRSLDDGLDPETIRIELDDPEPAVRDALQDASDLPAHVNAVDRRRGKGTAITAGFEALETDVLAFFDADGATDADAAAAVIDPVLDGTADLAVGSRRHPEAVVQSHQTVLRRALGDGFAWLARRVLGPSLYDYQCGAKAMTAETWRRVRDDVYEPGFAWDIELVALAGAYGARIREVPISWEDQPGSTVDPVRDTVRMFRGLAVAHHRSAVVSGSRLHRLLPIDPGPSLLDRLHGAAGRDGRRDPT